MVDAAMFDIDDTLITSLNGKRIENVYKLYNHMKARGYRMVIVTARPAFAANVKWTVDQLRRNNISYDTLVFASARDKGYYKRTSGYNFVWSVGDQDTDLTDSKYAIKIST
tara:strand:+ start:2664 stop:2996 length:333 start_codon:yes stop_codon:yes gene_type:complete